ncbi:MAG TPA: ABC transporter ATP-binding protein [Vicinamibacterales bacterium]|nr:ABC transporter ATP-binding protein [Vicinamibacterales bacterium]
MAERSSVVSLRGVTRSFGATVALEGIDLDVRTGQMYGLIGPDGAGKTTALRLVCGLTRPDAGQVRVFGVDPWRTRRVATSAIGYLSQRFSLYGDLSIDENIAFFARLHGLRHFDAARDRLLALTGLLPFRTRRADRLSGGMKQKLALACTLVHEPELLVLDEPTTGVDPVARREFWKLLAEFLDQKLTILMATPYLDEAERCTRVALIGSGVVLADDEPMALQQATPGVVVEVVPAAPRRAFEVLGRRLGLDRVQLFGDRVHVRLDAEPADGVVAGWLADAGIRAASVRRIVPTLEDVFIAHLTAAETAGGGRTS